MKTCVISILTLFIPIVLGAHVFVGCFGGFGGTGRHRFCR